MAVNIRLGSIFESKVGNENPALDRKEIIALPTHPIDRDDIYVIFKTIDYNVYCQKKDEFLKENNKLF